jgi:hypothetical protein
LNICPHCEETTIRTWQKLNASGAFPTSCPKCDGLSFVTAWWRVGSVLSFEFLFWGSILLAISLQSWLALALFPVGVAFILSMGRKLSLIPTDKAKSWSAKKKSLLQFSLFLLVLFIWVYFAGNL